MRMDSACSGHDVLQGSYEQIMSFRFNVRHVYFFTPLRYYQLHIFSLLHRNNESVIKMVTLGVFYLIVMAFSVYFSKETHTITEKRI